MKAKSIMTIRQMLIEEKERVRKEKDDIRNHLMNKYETDWIDSVANKDEIEILNMVQKKYFNISDALEDFEVQQWQTN